MTPAAIVLALAWALIAPALLLAAAPLLDGVGRQIRARLESRAGPPLLQGYLDLAKLAGKRERSAGVGTLASAAPWLALSAAVVAGLLLPVGGVAPAGFAGDGIVFLYLLGLSSAALVIGAASAGSAYGFVGAGREMVLLLFVEPVIAVAIFVLGLRAGTFRLAEMAAAQVAGGPSVSAVLAGLAVFAALLAYTGRLPFDLSEAEQELTGGALVEYGGPRLAVWRWAAFVRWAVVSWFVAEMFLPLPVPTVLRVVGSAVAAFAVFAVASVLAATLARLKLDGARGFMVQIGVLVTFALVFALIGA